MPRLSEVIAALDALWPADLAESWDAVGTVCGDPDAEVSRVLFAVDPVQEIADEAVRLGAQLLVTHHPLYLRGTTTVAASTFKGRVVHDLIKNDVALHVAHTNADRADPGRLRRARRAPSTCGSYAPSYRTPPTGTAAAGSAGSASSNTR